MPTSRVERDQVWERPSADGWLRYIVAVEHGLSCVLVPLQGVPEAIVERTATLTGAGSDWRRCVDGVREAILHG